MPIERHPMHGYMRGPVAIFTLVAVGIVLAGIFTLVTSSPKNTEAPAGFPADAPAPKPVDYVAAQKGFQYLIMYTGGSFVPRTLSVTQGETVRFTNNSDSTLDLSLFGATPMSLDHAEYYEYTFSEAGTFSYGDGTNTGTVTVNK